MKMAGGLQFFTQVHCVCIENTWVNPSIPHTHTHTITNALMCFLGTYGSLNLTFEDFFFFFFAFSKEIVI